MTRTPRPSIAKRTSRIGVRVSSCLLLAFALLAAPFARATEPAPAASPTSHAARARRFLAGRSLAAASPARALAHARVQHAAMIQARDEAADASLSASWQAVGPAQVASLAYGTVTGRISSIAIDPSDATGNTVYIGTTGGGVWRSINAAGPTAAVTFTPLTDDISVFSANADTSSVPSLSIGALTVSNGVILAGTGDPNDALDSYYGGGILRSTDNGLSWNLIDESRDGVTGNHSFIGLGFAAFAWAGPSSQTVIAALSQSAEGVIVNAPDQVNSVMGLYYSTDAGATWQMSVIQDGSQTVQTPQASGANHGGVAATSVVWNPIRQMFYAAIRYHGYYQSPDGVTWTRLAAQPGAGLTTTNCPTAPGTAGSPSCPIFRGTLAIQPVTGDLFALTVDSANNDQGLWQDVCAAQSGACANPVSFSVQLSSAAIEVGNGNATIAQGDYNLSLAASPTGSGPTADTILYAGTTDLFRCTLSTGCTWRNTTNTDNGCTTTAQVAPAQHAITLLPSSTLLYLGNDGGLWRSTDGVAQQGTPCNSTDASHFQNLNSGLGSLAEIVSFAQDPTNPQTLLAGLGANGSAGTGSASTAAWPQLSTGEGGYVAIDPANPLLWYLTTAAGVSIRQCNAGSSCTASDFTGPPTIGYTQVEGDDSLIDTPWLLDPALTSDVVIGTCRVWRGPANNGSAWSTANLLSAPLGGPQGGSCASANPIVRSLSAGDPPPSSIPQTGSQVLYAGMAGILDGGGGLGGHLFVTTSATSDTSSTAWTDLSSSPVTNGNGIAFNANGFDISSVVADPHDASGATVYATVMGFLQGTGDNAGHIYRSIDYGAHWTDITANLPDAPANSVLVDPNDANTIYVALDTGVYVTNQVTTCSPSINCWSVFGSGLPSAPVISLEASASLPTGDGRSGELRAGTYGRGIWQIPLLTAATAAQPAITLSPSSLTFAAQPVATDSTPQTITVTNSGVAPLTISQIVATGDFTETDTCTGASIAVSQTCTVQVAFAPTTTGTRTGVLTIYGNVPGGQATASLTGTATPGAPIVLTPINLSFPTTTIGSPSTAQNITLSNTGTTTITLQSVSVAASDYKISANTCGPSLAPQVGCTVAITFNPTASGTRTGILTVVDSSGTQTAQLTGTGVSPATDSIAPLSLAFAAQPLTTASTPQQVILTNSGDLPLTLIATSTTGDFTAVNACGNSLNGHSSCAIAVTFEPTNLGARTGTLIVSDQYRSQTVALSGTGIPAPGVSLAPLGTVIFPPTGLGITSATQAITLTNNQGTALSIQSVSLTGDFVLQPTGSTCADSVAAYSSCTVQVAFAPTAAGPRTGAVTIADAAANSPQTRALSGMGVDFTLAPDGNSTVTTTSGSNAVFPLLLSSPSTVTGAVQLTCSGFPANSTCNLTPSTVTLGGATTVSLTVLTGVSTSASIRAHPSPFLWLASLLPLGLLASRRSRRRLFAAGLLCALISFTGCGAGRIIPSSGSGSNPITGGATTPPGTYSVITSATYAGLTKTLNLTLIVQ